MSKYSNRTIFWVILFIISITYFIERFTKFHTANFMILFIGTALLILYKTKKKIWALIGGAYLFYFGLVHSIEFLGVRTGTPVIEACGLFIVPGIIFFILYLNTNKKGLLKPAAFLFYFGLNLFLIGLKIDKFFNINQFVLFILCMGFAFLTIFILESNSISISYLYIGIIFIVLSGFKIFSANLFGHRVAMFSPLSIAVTMCVFVGLYLVFFKKKKN